MPWWGVVLVCLGALLSCVLFGTINLRMQSRRCRVRCGGPDWRTGATWCTHKYAIFFGYVLLWPIILPSLFFYELVVGRDGVKPGIDRRMAKKAHKRQLEHDDAMTQMALGVERAEAARKLSEAERQATEAHMKAVAAETSRRTLYQ